MASNAAPAGASAPELEKKEGVETKTGPTTTSTAADYADIEDYPDPDEDDLDDLDDMLDQFSAQPKPEAKAPTPAANPTATASTGKSAAPPPAVAAEELSDEAFAKQFEAGMEQLMGAIDASPQMQAELEALLKDLADTDLAGAGASATAASSSAKPKVPAASKSKDVPTEDFQATIKKTMERMQASGEQATAAAAADDTDDFLAEIMKQMAAGGGLDGAGGEEDFSKMLLGMMEQLTNKEILYEPMKELHDKFPAWLQENEKSTPADDLKRYKTQEQLVGQIVARFERDGYTDENVEDREYIVERMHQMQAAGAPPPDLVGDMATAQEAFGGVPDGPDEGCPQQ